MSDAWTNRKQRCLINFLVSSLVWIMFVKSINGSNIVKIRKKSIWDAWFSCGENMSNYVLACKLLEEKKPHLYRTPCATHCIDLMLENIGKLPLIKKTIQRGVSLVGFIYSHSSTFNLLRQFTILLTYF